MIYESGSGLIDDVIDDEVSISVTGTVTVMDDDSDSDYQ
jgi:hypothetical protein